MTRTIVLLALLASSAAIAAQTATHRAFATPEDAVKALVDTVKAGNLDALLAIFGPEGRELVASSDPATARMNRRVFAVAFREQWHLEDATPDAEDAGRRQRELAFPGADRQRRQTDGDSTPPPARKKCWRGGSDATSWTRSRPSAPTSPRSGATRNRDTTASPQACTRRSSRAIPASRTACIGRPRAARSGVRLVICVAQAAEEGRPLGGDRAQPTPFHGYYFKILTGQGAAAPGGAKSYLVKGEMSRRIRTGRVAGAVRRHRGDDVHRQSGRHRAGKRSGSRRPTRPRER